jgi:hypothetical protein
VRTAAAAGNTITGLSQAASAMTIRPTVAASKNAWIPMIVPIVATRAEWATPCVGDATTSAGGAASRPARPRNLCAQPAPLPPCRQGCTDTAALDGGCRTKPRRGRWIVSKRGLRNRPPRPSRAAGPSRGGPARRLWRALPSARSAFSQPALCDSLDESTYVGGQSGLVRWRSRPVHMTVAQDVDHLPVGLTLQGAGCRGDALAL